MRINRTRTAAIALATACLFGLGSVAYADDNEISVGGHSTSQSTATNGGTVDSGGNTSTNSGDGGDVNTNTATCGGGGGTSYGLVALGDVNVCPVVNVPVLSPTRGGNASSGNNTSNSSQNAQSSSSSSADGKTTGDGHSHSNKSKKKKSKKKAKKSKKSRKHSHRNSWYY